jgi:GT2 family glycosyltransferase
MTRSVSLPDPIEFRAPGLEAEACETVVVLPTFRRPAQVVATLRSLAAQLHRHRAAVIVMDNDDDAREGLEAVRPLLLSDEVPGMALVARERGNCSAYNAGFRAALAEFPRMRRCLVIDDDELAGADWIERMTAEAERSGVDIVGGPQMPVFERGGNGRFERHPVFRQHYDRSGPVPILYSSGNVLISRTVLEAAGDPVLDTAFNFIGGGDSDFYSRMRERGFRFGWCEEAPVFETVPERRTRFDWVNARSLRNGAISSLIEHRRRPDAAGRARTLLKSAALLASAPARGLRLGWRLRSPVAALYPLQVALGRFQAEFGRVGEQYRQPERN